MAEPKAQPGWMVVDHFIPGCTEEMIAWWWINMEKGYELWEPSEHKGFTWEVPPPLNGHVGAIQIAKESIDYGAVNDLRIEWMDPNTAADEIKDWLIYKNVLCAGGMPAFLKMPRKINLTHQWEAVPGGCKMRSTMHGMGGPPPGVKLPTPPPHPSGKKASGGGWTAHNIAEVSTMHKFLPSLWGIWQSVTDPAINRKASFILKREGSKFVYV